MWDQVKRTIKCRHPSGCYISKNNKKGCGEKRYVKSFRKFSPQDVDFPRRGFSQLTPSTSPALELPQQIVLHVFNVLPRTEFSTSAYTTLTSHWPAANFHLSSGCRLQSTYWLTLLVEMWILNYSRGCSCQSYFKMEFKRNTILRKESARSTLTKDGAGLWLITESNNIGIYTIRLEPHSLMLTHKDTTWHHTACQMNCSAII